MTSPSKLYRNSTFSTAAALVDNTFWLRYIYKTVPEARHGRLWGDQQQIGVPKEIKKAHTHCEAGRQSCWSSQWDALASLLRHSLHIAFERLCSFTPAKMMNVAHLEQLHKQIASPSQCYCHLRQSPSIRMAHWSIFWDKRTNAPRREG